jgi:RNA polymerase sigma-70 factor (ECF subfamily)
VRANHASTLELIANTSDATAPSEGIPDERLRLLFVCAHPAIDPDVHTPLMLQTVLGLDAARIARAFLVSPAAMGQRLTRAKIKIRHSGIAFEIPETPQLPQRLEAVLNAIYAVYGSGWEDAARADPRTRGLAEEAIWLARVLRECLPEEPEVRGLLALMLHCEARRLARRSTDGRFVPLSDQDPDQWDSAMIAQAEHELSTAATAVHFGRFQIEAAIQSVHNDRARTGRTDWGAIAFFYARLVELSPTLGARVGEAAAVAESRGAAAGIALLEVIDAPAATTYQPYWALRGHLLQQLRRPDAADAFDHAIALTEDDAVRHFLVERRAGQRVCSQ